MEEKEYTFGYSPGARNILGQRTAEKEAGFLLPKLKPGVDLLDIGCGPGSITVGLAERVNPGRAIGVDFEESQVEAARQLAQSEQLKNLDFEVGDATQLRFEDASFDVVFGHTILMQFDKPELALAEAARVLKPGGIIAFRELAGLWLIRPTDGARRRYMDLFTAMLKRNGKNPEIGASLGSLLGAQGFAHIEHRASFTGPTTMEQRVANYQNISGLCREAAWMDRAIELGWLTATEREQLADDLVNEGQDPGAVYATAFCEVVGIKTASDVSR